MIYDSYQEQLDEELVEACKIGDLGKVKELLTSNEPDEVANIDPGTWRTPLGEACWYGHLDIVKYLLTSPNLKLHANMFDSDSRCLIYAAYEGHLDIVQYLLTSPELKSHIDINEREEDRILDTACSKCHLEIVKYIMESEELQQKPNEESLQRAINSCFQEKTLDIIQYFIFLEHPNILGIIKEQLDDWDNEFEKQVRKLVEQKELIRDLDSDLQLNTNTKKSHKL